MKKFTKHGIALVVGILCSAILFAQTSFNDIDPKPQNVEIPQSDAMFDVQFDFPVGVGGGEGGIETDGNYIYTSMWNGAGEFQKYSIDGTWLETFTVPSSDGCRDLAYNGTYFYGSASSTTVLALHPTKFTAIAIAISIFIFYFQVDVY